jgi:MoxR-like ATPase
MRTGLVFFSRKLGPTFNSGPINAAEVAGERSRHVWGSSRPDDSRADEYVKDYVSWGAGPRGSQNLVLAAKARALLLGRTAPTVADVRTVALPILRHRIIVSHRAVGDSITSEHVLGHLLAAEPAAAEMAS